MTEPTPAQRAVAHADVADSAERSANLLTRTITWGITALVLGVGAIVLAMDGSLLQGGLAAAATVVCLRRSVQARREEKRVFALAVKAMEDNRAP
jgi:hypothetical protein